MGRVLIIGAGGVGTVVAHKVAQNADVNKALIQRIRLFYLFNSCFE